MVGYHQIVPTYIKKLFYGNPYQKDINGMIPNLFIISVETEGVNSFNFLAITLDENITWKLPIAAIANKLSKHTRSFDKLIGLHSKDVEL